MHVDIGFAFMPQYEGRGYGLESSSAILEYAKNTLKLECICAIIPFRHLILE
jgi:RimJ/RimL family protein N-acetyltransferase